MESKIEVATLIPYKIVDNEIFIYLQKRSHDAPSAPNFFSFFGGHLEENETPEETIKREIKEELNVDLKDHNFLGKYSWNKWINYSYGMKVSDDFDKIVVVSEGDYGKFFSRREIDNGLEIIESDRALYEGFYKFLDKQKH